tara:strand:- start:462 stop:581 length:120 start_codon:yes stop_codon:yes gene_type:complete
MGLLQGSLTLDQIGDIASTATKLGKDSVIEVLSAYERHN